MFKYVKDTVIYYFAANNDGEEETSDGDKEPEQDSQTEAKTQTKETQTKEEESTKDEKYTQTESMSQKDATTQTTEASPKKPITETNKEIDKLIQDLIDQDVLKNINSEEDGNETPDSLFSSSDEEATNITTSSLPPTLTSIPTSVTKKYEQNKPCPLSHKKETLLKQETHISPTYSETIKINEKLTKKRMNATQAKIRPLFDVSGSATATIQLKPEILALLKKRSSSIDDEEELFMKEQRRSLRLANKRMCKNPTLKPIVPKAPLPNLEIPKALLPELSFQKSASMTNLKIKLPKRNSIISPSKIPPNPPRGETSSITSPPTPHTHTSLLTTQSPPSRPKSDPFRYNLRKRIDKNKTY